MNKLILIFVSFICLNAVARNEGDTLHVKLKETNIIGVKKNIEGQSHVKLKGEALLRAPLFMGEKDILKSLQLLPGVDAAKDGSSVPSIRGGTTDQSLLLIDGMPFFNTSHAFGLISTIDPNMIESVDLYKGAFPARYGNRLSGIIDMQTKNISENKFRGGVSVGTISASGNLEIPVVKDKTYFLLTGRRSTIDLIAKGVRLIQEESTIPEPAFGDVYGKLTHRFSPKSQLTMSGSFTDDHLSFPSKGVDYKSNFSFNWRTAFGEANWMYTLNENLNSHTKVYYNQLRNQRKTLIKDSHTSMDDKLSSEVGEWSVRQMFDYKKGKHRVNSGISFSQTAFKPLRYSDMLAQESFDESKILSSGAVWIEERWNPNSKWSITPMLRATLYSNQTDTKFIADPRLRINYALNNDNLFEFNLNSSSQPIDIAGQSALNFPMEFWMPFGNNKISRSELVSLGWKNQSLQNIEFSAEAYYKNVRDQRFIYSYDDYINYNEGGVYLKGKAYGIESFVQWNCSPFQLSLSYAYSRSLNKYDRKWTGNYQDIPHRLTLWGNYGFDFKKKKSNLSFLLNYHSGTPFVLPEGLYPSYDDDALIGELPVMPNHRSKRYFRLDISYSVTTQLKRGTGTWNFSIMNITAHKNPYMIYRTADKGYRMMVLIPFLPSFSYRFEF